MMKYKAFPIGQKAALTIIVEEDAVLLCFAPNVELSALFEVLPSVGSFESVALLSENAIKRILPMYVKELPDNQKERFWSVLNGVICQNRTYY